MSELSRRGLLRLTGALGMGAVLARGSAAAAIGGSVDMAVIVSNFAAIHAGTSETNVHPAVRTRIADIQRAAAGYRSRLRDPQDWGRYSGVIRDIRLGLANSSTAATASGEMTTTFRVLSEIALATATPGAEWFRSTSVQDDVIDALRWLLDSYYDVDGNVYEGTGDTYGDWYDWEIATPTHITRTLTYLHDRISAVDPGIVEYAIATMDNHLVFEPKFHSGANRADIAVNYLVQGAIVGDQDRVIEGIQQFVTVTDPIDPINPVDGNTDGFYADGSFLQHGDVPYTGSYGKNLLERVARLTRILDGSGQNLSTLPELAVTWVRNSFAPIIYEAYVLEAVKGRIAARVGAGYEDAPIVASALTDLLQVAPGAGELASYVKFLAASDFADLTTASFDSPGTIATFDQLMNDGDVQAQDSYFATGHATFNSMERDVHGRPEYRFAIARSSSRIAKYETMSGANPRPWFQGEGAYYLYLAGEDHSTTYAGAYFHAVDPTKLAGVTAQVDEVRERTGTSPPGTNDHSGGASLDGYGTAGMRLGHEFNLVYLNPEGIKSWYMFDDEIIVLAAGLMEPSGRDLRTSVDTRLTHPNSPPTLDWVTRDGLAGSGEVTAAVLQHARWSDPSTGQSIGYAFLDEQPVDVQVEAVEATVNDVLIEQNVANLSYLHSGTDPTSVAYAIVPNATDAQLAGYGGGRLAVLANTTTVQSVRQMDAGVMMANFFGAGEVDVLDSDGPASIVMRVDTRGQMRLGLSEPTFERQEMGIQIVMPSLGLVSADPGVHVSTTDGVTTLMVDSANAWGKVFTVELIDTVAAMAAIEAMLETGLQDGSLSSSGVARVRVPLQVVTRHLEADRRTAGLAVLRGQFREKLRSATARGDITTDLASDITDITTTVIDTPAPGEPR